MQKYSCYEDCHAPALLCTSVEVSHAGCGATCILIERCTPQKIESKQNLVCLVTTYLLRRLLSRKHILRAIDSPAAEIASGRSYFYLYQNNTPLSIESKQKMIYLLTMYRYYLLWRLLNRKNILPAFESPTAEVSHTVLESKLLVYVSRNMTLKIETMRKV